MLAAYAIDLTIDLCVQRSRQARQALEAGTCGDDKDMAWHGMAGCCCCCAEIDWLPALCWGCKVVWLVSSVPEAYLPNKVGCQQVVQQLYLHTEAWQKVGRVSCH
jgi:hypothetical protein